MALALKVTSDIWFQRPAVNHKGDARANEGMERETGKLIEPHNQLQEYLQRYTFKSQGDWPKASDNIITFKCNN